MTEKVEKVSSTSFSATAEVQSEVDVRGDIASSSGTNLREVLCYPCALRMSILHHFSPPLTTLQVLEQSKVANDYYSSLSRCPLVDTTSHPRFFIVHETENSVSRCFDDKEEKDLLRSRMVNATISGDAKTEDSPAKISWVCVACAGLYQFLNLVYAPLLAAAVRRSPFFDSQSISVNVGVHRSFTFIWLAASIRYFDRSFPSKSPEDVALRPSEKSVIPQEWSNFKEFFVSDLRARVMAYLRQPHENCVSLGEDDNTWGRVNYLGALGIKAKCSNEFHERMTAEGEQEECELSPLRKKAKMEEEVIVEEEKKIVVRCPTTQAFLYSGENEGVLLDVNCTHLTTESVVTRSGLPTVFAGNRSECVLSYGTLYEYVCPYLQKIGWGLPCRMEHELSNSSEGIRGSVVNHVQTVEVSTMFCEISHANIFLLGNYRKMSRNLSQSPWFSDGKRVGSFSLQEAIAAPLLPFFFPEGVRPIVLNSKVLAASIANAAKYPDGGLAARRAGLTTKLNVPSESPHPSIIAAESVYGYGRYKFHSAGREDVDVRMLGGGRPFVLEMVSPSREQFSPGDLAALTEEINECEGRCVEILRLRQTGTSVTKRLARHSESKIKRYRCVVWSSRSIPSIFDDPLVQRVMSMKDVAILQKTPLRVLHRRSLHARERTVHSMNFEQINDHWFIFDIETQAGTYIKEFIHGDLGRTLPNLGTLLHSRLDILQLDVIDMTVNDVDEHEVEDFSPLMREC